MVDLQNIHWTADGHLLGQYVLGKLDAAQAGELDNHLRSCSQCRDAVAAEKQLAAGVRRAGRGALKRRLSEQLKEKRTGTNWYKIAGVAAAFILLLTVGIYNKWFFSGETPFADSRLKSDSIAPKAEATPQQPIPEQQSAGKIQLADAAKPSLTDRGYSETKGGGAKSTELDKKVAGEKSDVTNMPAPGLTGDVHSRKDQYLAVVQTAEGIWVEGTVLAEASARVAGKVMEKNADEILESARKEKREPSAMLSAGARSNSFANEASNVVVTRRPVADLPLDQLRGKQGPTKVKTLFQTDAAGISMFIYSDSLLTRKDLGGARLQTITADSILLQIGNQRIGYRVPPGLTEQLAKQLQKAR